MNKYYAKICWSFFTSVFAMAIEEVLISRKYRDQSYSDRDYHDNYTEYRDNYTDYRDYRDFHFRDYYISFGISR